MYPHCLMTRHSWYLIQEPLLSLILFPCKTMTHETTKKQHKATEFASTTDTMFLTQDYDFLYCWYKVLVLKFPCLSGTFTVICPSMKPIQAITSSSSSSTFSLYSSSSWLVSEITSCNSFSSINLLLLTARSSVFRA